MCKYTQNIITLYKQLFTLLRLDFKHVTSIIWRELISDLLKLNYNLVITLNNENELCFWSHVTE